MLIDQMKEHPEEFRGYGAKFTGMLDMARDALQGPLRNVWMSQRDATAIMAAAETHLYEVWLAEDVLTTIMRPKVEAEELKYPKASTGVLRQGAISNSTLSNNTAASQYEQAYQMELAKYKAELAKQRQQENEYAMRLTKPFGNF